MKIIYPFVTRPKTSERYLVNNPSYWVVKIKHSKEKWDVDYYTFQTRKRALQFYGAFKDKLEKDKYYAGFSWGK